MPRGLPPAGLAAAPPEGGPGLSTAEAARRRGQWGPNELERAERTPRWRTFAAQFASPLVGLLLVAAVLGERADAGAIVVIVLLNAAVGYLQERRAEDALLALRSLTAPRATVLRDGHAVVLAAAEVVPGAVVRFRGRRGRCPCRAGSFR